jgi:hypothetical protein
LRYKPAAKLRQYVSLKVHVRELVAENMGLDEVEAVSPYQRVLWLRYETGIIVQEEGSIA